MTTIVYDHKNKQVAIDSRINSDGIIESDSFDKTMDKEGVLWLFAGNISDYEILSNLSHDDKPDVHPGCSAMLIKDKKIFTVHMNGDYCSHTAISFNKAIGSGRDFAISALYFDKTAKEAIEFAAIKDCYTGGKIRVFNLDGKEIE